MLHVAVTPVTITQLDGLPNWALIVILVILVSGLLYAFWPF